MRPDTTQKPKVHRAVHATEQAEAPLQGIYVWLPRNLLVILEEAELRAPMRRPSVGLWRPGLRNRSWIWEIEGVIPGFISGAAQTAPKHESVIHEAG
jgi:hypothetical protein